MNIKLFSYPFLYNEKIQFIPFHLYEIVTEFYRVESEIPWTILEIYFPDILKWKIFLEETFDEELEKKIIRRYFETNRFYIKAYYSCLINLVREYSSPKWKGTWEYTVNAYNLSEPMIASLKEDVAKIREFLEINNYDKQESVSRESAFLSIIFKETDSSKSRKLIKEFIESNLKLQEFYTNTIMDIVSIRKTNQHSNFTPRIVKGLEQILSLENNLYVQDILSPFQEV